MAHGEQQEEGRVAMREGYHFSAQGLTVGYDNIPLIKDITFNLKKGEILTLIGPNGSGKSTILKSITQHLATLGGVIYIDKDRLCSMSDRERALKLAVVLTDRLKTEMMSCRDVAALGRYPYTGYFGLLTREDERIVTEALKRVNALDIQDRDFGSISDGQRQRIMLARAICQRPEVIVLDEPTSFLDIRYKIELLEILRKMAVEDGITVIMSLHEIDLAHKISDAVMCVKGDRISRYGRPSEIFTDEFINELYDLRAGSYNALSGSVELPPAEGRPSAFVVGGGGFGIPVYRELQRRGIPFAAGIIFDNDMDMQVAGKSASLLFHAPAFMPVTEELYKSALDCMLSCAYVIDSGCPVGEYNACNGRLLEAAKHAGLYVSDIGAVFNGLPK
jgi:iron complex transport system ATP-binding protein